jgi:phospholipase/carboxylesterase
VSDLDVLEHVVRDSNGDPEGTLVLLHGRGAHERDLFPLLDLLDPERRLLGVTPRAPLSLPPFGAHWYVVRQVGHPDRETFTSTQSLLCRWLDALAAETGIPAERTVIGGFSQGAVMSYATGLAPGRPRPTALIALSGFVPVVEGFELDLDRPIPPVAIGHGTMDTVIRVEFGRKARALLEDAGAQVLYRESPMPHSVDPGFLEELAPWIRSALGKRLRAAR